MRVLWITYVVFPEALEMLTGKPQQKKGSGGWLFGSAEAILDNTDIELRVACVARNIPEYKELQGGRIRYYMIPFGKGFDKYHHGYDEHWKHITQEFKPDIVHIHGVESTLALSYIRTCGNKNVVVSIQGLAGIIARYYYDGISNHEINKNITIGDILRRKTLHQYKKDFFIKGRDEENILKEVEHVIGRTTWDKSHILAVNSQLSYHFCNETLRGDFYNSVWKYKECRKHTIFLSAISASFKGGHFLFKALPLIVQKYPDVEVRIAGLCNISPQGFSSIIHQTGYEHYLSSLINDLGIATHLKFLGSLTAEEMRDEYLRANVFVCPSTIENSSNSVAEAQILGVPLVASYVGGIPDMIPDDDCGKLFRCGEYEMLASLICELFETSKTFDNTRVRDMALKRHDRKNNALTTYNIYKEIIEDK